MEQKSEWPSKFVYVCNASQAAIVNVLPIAHAGMERISEIVVLCGARSANVDDPQLRREAIEPADRLEQFIRLFASSPAVVPKVSRRFGDAGRFSEWTKHMEEIERKAHRQGLRLVYNMTGGTKPMGIGACLAFRGAKSPPVLVYVAGNPLRTEFIDGTTQIEAPRQSELNIAQYLASYGITEVDPAEREANEQFYRAHQAQILIRRHPSPAKSHRHRAKTVENGPDIMGRGEI